MNAHLEIPETDELIDILTAKLLGEDKQGTMELANQLYFKFYKNPLYGKVSMLGTYDRI